MMNKEQILEVANIIKDATRGRAIFLGGASEVLQGIKDETKDIDLLVDNIVDLSIVGPVFNARKEPIDGNMIYFMKINGHKVELYHNEEDFNSCEYVEVEGVKCTTIDRIIEGKERIYAYMSGEENLSKIRKDIERLKKIKRAL